MLALKFGVSIEAKSGGITSCQGFMVRGGGEKT